jgi:hypothetical protein
MEIYEKAGIVVINQKIPVAQCGGFDNLQDYPFYELQFSGHIFYYCYFPVAIYQRFSF